MTIDMIILHAGWGPSLRGGRASLREAEALPADVRYPVHCSMFGFALDAEPLNFSSTYSHGYSA